MEFESLTVLPMNQFFSNEPEFTQWLRDNPSYLEEILNVELAPGVLAEAVQKGGLVIDLVASIKKNENLKVIIENQFGISDHKHLGQLMSYIAESDAKVAVWISETIRNEHREALNQLNRSFGQERFFFGVEVQAIRIGSKKQKPAISFNVVVAPEEWEEWVFTYQLSTPEGIYYDFWKQIMENFALTFHNWQPKKPGKDNWTTAHSTRGIGFNWSFKDRDPNKSFYVEVTIDFSDASKNDLIFNELKKQSQEIEKEMQCTLNWDQQPKNKRCLINTGHHKKFRLNEIPRDPLRKELIEWGVPAMKSLISSFEDRLLKINF